MSANPPAEVERALRACDRCCTATWCKAAVACLHNYSPEDRDVAGRLAAALSAHSPPAPVVASTPAVGDAAALLREAADHLRIEARSEQGDECVRRIDAFLRAPAQQPAPGGE